MSSQPTLNDYLLDQATDEAEGSEHSVEILEGARYGGRRDRDHSERARNPGQCQNCGQEIPDVYQRIIGDDYGRVPVCDRVECQQDQGLIGDRSASMRMSEAVHDYKTRGLDR